MVGTSRPFGPKLVRRPLLGGRDPPDRGTSYWQPLTNREGGYYGRGYGGCWGRLGGGTARVGGSGAGEPAGGFAEESAEGVRGLSGAHAPVRRLAVGLLPFPAARGERLSPLLVSSRAIPLMLPQRGVAQGGQARCSGVRGVGGSFPAGLPLMLPQRGAGRGGESWSPSGVAGTLV